MAGEKLNFRATLFLEEHFSFLQENDDSQENSVCKIQSLNDDYPAGGPLSNSENVDESVYSESNIGEDDSRASVSSSISSRQSDISQSMSLRTSSASESSRASGLSSAGSSKPEGEHTNPSDKDVADDIQVTNVVTSNNIENETDSSAKDDTEKETAIETQQSINTIVGDAKSIGDDKEFGEKSDAESSLISQTKNEGTASEIQSSQEKEVTDKGEESETCSINKQGAHVSLPNQTSIQTNTSDTSSPHEINVNDSENQLRPSVLRPKDSSSGRDSILPDGTRVSLFVAQSFDFLSEEDTDSSDSESEVSASSEVKVNTDANLQKAGDVTVGTKGSGNSETVGNACSHADIIREESSPTTESNTTEMSTKDETEVSKDSVTSVQLRDSISDPSRRSTVSKFIRDEFSFLPDTEESDNEGNDSLASETGASEKTAEEDGGSKSVVKQHSRNISSEIAGLEKPQSPVIQRVRKSDVSHGSLISERSSSISPGQSSRSSTSSSGTESDQPQPKPITRITAGISRSVSITTTASESEFRIGYRQKDIERPKKEKKKTKSKSFSKFVRQTTYIPEITVILEKTDPKVPYGFHFMKGEDSTPISPWFISTVEQGGIAQANGIEVGSKVVNVNGEDIVQSSLERVVELIQTDPCKVELTLFTSSDPVHQKSGYLWKQSSGLRRVFKKRWFILKQDNCLYYYKTEEDIDPLGAICLSNYSVSKATDIDPSAFKLHKFEQRTYVFKADSVEEMAVWGGVIKQAANARNRSYPETTTHHLNLPAIQIRDPDFHGYLHKRGDSHKVWRKRYCVLKDGSLFYYKDPDASQAKGVAHLHGYLMTSETVQGRKYCFVLSPPELKLRTYHFGTDTESERKKWTEALHKSISRWRLESGEDVT